jgi:hypothetical protein
VRAPSPTMAMTLCCSPLRSRAVAGGHGGAGVTGTELVVLAFTALEETGDTLPLAQGGKHIVASGQQLPRIGLVSHIPDDFIVGRLEFVQQRDAEFDHTKGSADVPAGDRATLDEPVTNLLGQLRQLVPPEPLQILW